MRLSNSKASSKQGQSLLTDIRWEKSLSYMYIHGGCYNLTGPRDRFLTWVEYNILFFQKKIFKGQIYCALVTQMHQASKGNLYLLTSYNVDDVIERAPRDDNDIVTLMAQGVKQDFNYRESSGILF